MNNNYGYPDNLNKFDYSDFLESIGINEISNATSNDQLFGSYEGYIKGNLFKDLYDEYKNYSAIRLPVNSEKMELLLNLNQMQFGMHEMNLYLDVFPNDVKAIKEFNKFRDEYARLLKEYERKYVPLNICDENLNSIPFAWEDSSFPWEGGE